MTSATRLHEECAGNLETLLSKKVFRNFQWTNSAINDWEKIWYELWHLGYKWEWQNSDRYARRNGEVFNLYAVYNDAERLDMAIPLPQISVIHQIRENLLDNPSDDFAYDHVVGLIQRWFAAHHKI